MTDTVAAETALAGIIDAVAVARHAVAEGAQVDLAGLDSAVTRVCETAHDLPQGLRDAYARRLVELSQALDLLAGDIIALKDAPSQRQRAQEAYGGEDGA
jgi:hypothetical protein